MQAAFFIVLDDCDVELLDARQQFANLCDCAVHDFNDISRAIEALRAADRCDLLVIAQARPASISHRQWRQLHSASPSTPAVALLGTWCEGNERTGQPLAGLHRVYWHAWPTFLAAERARMQAGRPPLWALPQSMTEADRALAARVCSDIDGSVVISSSDSRMSAFLADAFACHGWHVRTPQPDSQSSGACDLIVWEAPHVADIGVLPLHHLRLNFPGVPIMVLAGFPRAEQIAVWTNLGAVRVLPKPFVVEELLSAAASLVTARPTHA